jgi:hypothetical protein
MTNEDLRCWSCGEHHENARLIKTQDGRQLGLHSEDYRRYTEAKWVLGKYRSKQTRQRYLVDIQATRGQAAAIELREEMLRIWTYRKAKNSDSRHG